MLENKMKKRNKKGQLTIFIIIGIMIIIAGILLYTFYPEIKTILGFEEKNPDNFMQECMEEIVNEKIKKISLQGGSLNPEHYFLYNNENIEYLCYINENYKTCIVQQPLLKRHIEEELKEGIKKEAYSCLDKLKESYEERGYNVVLKRNEIDVELLPKRITINFNSSLTLSKEETKRYDSINMVLNNNLYELVSIANSIIDWEASYGDAETTTYMVYYHDLKVEKKKQSEGTTIYILTDRNTGNKFQFASRSVAWPAGY